MMVSPLQALSFEHGFSEMQGSIACRKRGRDASQSKETSLDCLAPILLTQPLWFTRHCERVPLDEGCFHLDRIVL